MAAKIFEFQPKLASPMHRLYLVVQEASNQANALKVTAQALSAREKLDAVTCITLMPDEQQLRGQQIAKVKYDAQLVEQKARNIGETLTHRQADFASEASFLLRQLHALDAEIGAIETQLICAGLIADTAEREGHDRPVSECDFLSAKAERKQAAVAALQLKIGAQRASSADSGSGSVSDSVSGSVSGSALVAASLPTI